MSGDQEQEKDLLERLRRGEDQVLGELFDLHRERLWRMAHFRLNPRLASRVDPDDVLQEAFLDARQRLDAWRAKADKSFFVWLRLIVGQTLADLHRAHLGAKKRDMGRESPPPGVGPGVSCSAVNPELVASLTSPSQAAVREEDKILLERALAGMEPIDREILSLRHFEGLTNGEVSELLDLKPSAASNRYIRALGRIRALFEEGDHGGAT